MRKILFILFISVISLFLVSCNKNKDNDKLTLTDTLISFEEKFGGVYINITIEDFNKLGFAFGDSLDIYFSNGYKLLDLPYYNGYYNDTGTPLLVGYPGYPYIRVGINNGDSLWELGGFKDNETARIELNSKAKYLDIQQAMDIHYTDIQGDIPDEVFGNFRVVNVGNLKENILYRSASPVDNQHNRASVVDRLINNKVNTIINLSDNDQELLEHTKKEDFNSPYFYSLYQKHQVIALSMNMNFKNSKGEEIEAPTLFKEYLNSQFSDKLITGLRFMLNNDGPYLIHCVEGKDRTGFVCMVIEALASASYNEIVNDYMITYDNYYGIKLNSEPNKYNIIKSKNIEEMLRTIIGDESVNIKTADYGFYSKKYLLSKGMEEAEIIALIDKITK